MDASLKAMEIISVYIALAHAISKQDGKLVQQMKNEQLQAVLLYKTTMSGVKHLLSQGLISTEEYAEIDTMIAQKYGLSLSVIYRLKPLI